MGCADGLFFYPDRTVYTAREALPFAVREVHFDSEDGTRLHGWFCQAEGAARGAIFFCHGNAANLTNHISAVDWLPAAGYHLFIWDYRGFGASQGTPSKSGLKEDTRAALETFLELPEVKQTGLPRVAFGQSLGAAYVSLVAAERPDAWDGVILESPFTSHVGMAIHVLQGNPVTYLLSWPLAWLLVSSGPDPVERVRGLRVPLLVMHGLEDRVIPFDMGKKVFEAAQEPKQFLAYPGGHIASHYFVRPQMIEFLRTLRQTGTME